MKYKVDFKKMSKRERFEYIWDYYRFPAAIILFFAIIIFSFVFNLYQGSKQMLSVIVVTPASTETYSEEDFIDFFKSTDLEYTEEALSLEVMQFIGDDNYDYNTQLKLDVTLAAAGSEIIIGKGDNFDFCVSEGVFMDLRTILSEDLLTKYSDSLIYCESESGSQYPCAVALANTQFSQMHPVYEDCFFGVLYRSDHEENAFLLANYLLANN